MRRLFVQTVMLAALAGVAAAQWSFVQPMNRSRAGNASAIAKDGTIYTAGGNIIGDPDMTHEFESYDPVLNIWTYRAPMPTPRTALAAAYAAGKVYVFGGCPESHGYGGVVTLEIYDPVTDTWTTGPDMPTGRTGLEAVTGKDGRIYVIGGHAIPGGHLNVVEIFDPKTNTWTTGAPMPTARQEFGATRGPDGRIYVIGGSDQWRSGIMDIVEIYDPTSNSWTTGAPMPTKRDGVGAVTGPDGLIYAVGGWVGEYPHWGDITELVEIYNPVTNTWTTGPSMLVDEYGPAMVADATRIYSIGGGGYGTSALVQVYAPPRVGRTRRHP